jgi:hypothetical protein
MNGNVECALQGRLGSWCRDANYFNLRDLASGLLIKCFYGPELCNIIDGIYEDANAVVNLSGIITAWRVNGQVREMRVTWARSYAPLSTSEYNKLFGLAPDLTGDMSAADYIEKVRSDGVA